MYVEKKSLLSEQILHSIGTGQGVAAAHFIYP